MSRRDEGALWRWQHSEARNETLSTDPVEFSHIEGWSGDDHCAALACYLRSASLAGRALPKPAGASLPASLGDASKARIFFEENFAAFRILAEPGLLTSYFQPVLKGSRTPSPAFPIPVLRRPTDVKPLPPAHPLCAEGLTAGRELKGGFEPYFTRADIEAGALAGQGLDIVYLADAIDAFIMHVQGSGHIEFEDGTVVRLSFDGKNGRPYTSIAKRLVEQGHLTAEDAHLEGMTAWLRAQPQPAIYLNENRSYIFFKELGAIQTGPKGSHWSRAYCRPELSGRPAFSSPWNAHMGFSPRTNLRSGIPSADLLSPRIRDLR